MLVVYHMSGKKTTVKKRNWAFVCYPDSLPTDWLDVLQQTGLPLCISPLHDKDLDPTGTPKKPHYHVILNYEGPTSAAVVKALVTGKLNAPDPQPLESIRGYYRYLTHKDNPEKYQYDERDIKTINGFNISNFIELTRAETTKIKSEIQALIREQKIIEYADLLDYLLDSEMFTELDVAQSNTMLFNTYIRSRRHKPEQKTGKTVFVDAETGEILDSPAQSREVKGEPSGEQSLPLTERTD